MHRYDVTVTTGASPETVWKLLVDASSWPLWSKVDSLDTARSAGLDPGGDAVGAVRAFRTGRTVTGERLTEKVEGRVLAYEDAFNSSMRNYHARIELTPAAGGSGTVIHWYGEYETSRLLGWFMPRYLRKFMRGMAEGLARYAEEHSIDADGHRPS
ncbi:SRPBCC family protein [Streptomyces sp. NPDC020571]|uniref:SRPBCC family protein n=1 Tax=Streptomyces sp. NPDC020571 TaxID=3365079 RepID=UPI00379B7EBA